ncbi:phosphoethanolamine--lipid A transferase [Variovorax sp.]|uniref:phosphoethanolamine transferase n=1 Tax=Variovorax sp. TaxID=1871043 RepID=UPI002D6733D7|nr:phosphoethanolamine--lipid A transferase [Variovorax sp.]HYP83306.1 phosphoethanolamine--lipid A transferase [Variovorax sp.]
MPAIRVLPVPSPPAQEPFEEATTASRLGAWLFQARSARGVAIGLSLYLLVFANWPLWHELARIGGGAPSVYLPSILMMGALVFCANLGVLMLFAWPRTIKPAALVVLTAAAVAQHFMLSYRVVMDPTMLANAVQTDAHEVMDLLNWQLFFNLLAVLLPAAWWLRRVRITPMRPLAQVLRNLGMLLATAALAALVVVGANHRLAPLMRNHVGLRYMMNPVASLYSGVKVWAAPLLTHRRKLIKVSGGATLGAGYAAQTKPPLFLLVVGETARADHFSLNGYTRDTTPELAARGVINWRNARSCGTSTLASVPCMFSPLGKAAFESRHDDYENLMDVLQAAGLAVFWLDNQPGGCKGVCDRIPHASSFANLDAATRKKFCDGDECRDDVLLQGLDARIAALPAERRAKGLVLVMHQMGSHGPAYYKRSASESKRFLPECTNNALADCSHGELVNAYDNSIVATDHFLGRSIDWLKGRQAEYDTAMLYMSDHGESLGEYGLFLHGVPYSFAPEVQKHVPWVMWLSDGMRAREKLAANCLGTQRDEAISHDNLYHTALGLMDVKTPTYHASMDVLSACRRGSSDL